VFAALADGEARQIWMNDPDFKSDGTAYELDFRVGGYERFGGRAPDGTTHRCLALIYDIGPDRRVIYGYEMYVDGTRVSVSLATVEIASHAVSTRLTFTEQGAWLDGLDTPEAREGGWQNVLDHLGAYLSAQPAGGARR
jgi:uncharacterized protein YndB with AHSA1/START domain